MTWNLQLGIVTKLKGWTWNPLSPVTMWSGEVATYLGEVCAREQQARGIPVAWTMINGPQFIFSVHCMCPRFAMLHLIQATDTCWGDPQEARKSVFFLFVFFYLSSEIVLMGLYTVFNATSILFFFMLYVYISSYTIFPKSKYFYLPLIYQALLKDYSIKIKHESNFCSHW